MRRLYRNQDPHVNSKNFSEVRSRRLIADTDNLPTGSIRLEVEGGSVVLGQVQLENLLSLAKRQFGDRTMWIDVLSLDSEEQ